MIDCVFCHKVDELDPLREHEVVYFEPLNPVTPGHMLFVPTRHLVDAAQNPWRTGSVFAEAADYAQLQGGQPFNLITSRGVAATQSVFHLHVHYVPRSQGDGLLLPWSNQHA